MVALGSSEIRVPAHAGIVGQAFQSNQIIHVPHPYEDPRFNSEPDHRSGFVTRNLLTAPMVGIDQKPVGVIQAVNKKGEAFDETDPAILQLLADHAGVAIQRFYLQEAAVQSAALRREMDLAKRVQEGLIPTQWPQVAGMEVIGWTRSASITGGDCFDVWTLPDGRIGIFLGDASGHGIAPALIVSQVRTLIRAMVDMEVDPRKLLARVNARMYEDLKEGQFVTVFLGFLSGDGTLEWTSAGHGPVLFQASPNASVQQLDPPCHPIGFTADWPCEARHPLRLEPGGRLIVSSDGIFEAFDPDGRLFEVDRLIKLLQETNSHTAAETIARIRQAMDAWQTREEPHDDQTVVIVRRDSDAAS
jgi:phosphoserine phosphatase